MLYYLTCPLGEGCEQVHEFGVVHRLDDMAVESGFAGFLPVFLLTPTRHGWGRAPAPLCFGASRQVGDAQDAREGLAFGKNWIDDNRGLTSKSLRPV